MANELVFVRQDLDELKKEVAIIKSILLSLQMRNEESFEEELEAWDRASDEDFLSFEKSL